MKKLLSVLLIAAFVFAFGCSKMRTEPVTTKDAGGSSGESAVIPEGDLFFCGNWNATVTGADGTEYAVLLELGSNGKAVYKYGLPESELIEYYEGEWAVKDGMLCFDLKGGFVNTDEESAPDEQAFCGSFDWEMGGECIVLSHYEGNNFLEGSQNTVFRFEAMD